jgi:hypothetical protein
MFPHVNAGASVIDTPAELTADWLTAALGLDGSRVTDFTTTPVGTGQMADTVRIEAVYDPPQAGPATVVAKFASRDPNSRAAGSLARCYEIEVSIYSQLPALPGVPGYYYAARDPETDSFTLLLEDMAPCRQGDDISGCGLPVAAAALRRLAALHAVAWEDPSYAAYEWLNRSTPESTANMTGIIAMLAPSFLERFASRLEPEHRALVERLVPHIGAIISRYDGPRTLVHGDYRLDNMLFRDDSEEPIIVDWQTASWGAPAADVAYFIGGSLTTEDRRRHSAELLDTYHAALVDAGVTGYSRQQLEDDVRLTSFGGVVMAFASAILVVQTERGDDMFAEMFRRHAQHVLDLDAEAVLPAASTADHTVTAEDEGRHPPGDEQLWNESWYADVVSPDGAVGAYVRLGLYPNLDAAWWHLAVVGPGRPLLLCARTDLGVPADALVAGGEDVAVEIVVEEPLRSFAVRGSMTAARYGSAQEVYDGKPGDPVAVDVDLTWHTDGVPYHYGATTRYEVPCTVSGTLRVDGETMRLDGPGQRDHSWGVRDWWAFGWCWSAGHLDDGTHVHLTEVRLPSGTFCPGYVQHGEEVRPVVVGSVTETTDAEGFATTATIAMDGLEITIDPLAYGPLLLTAPDGRVGRFPRAAARFTTGDGRSGLGWIEWNQPPL